MIGSGGRPYGTTLGAAGDLMTEATSRVKVLRRKPAAE